MSPECQTNTILHDLNSTTILAKVVSSPKNTFNSLNGDLEAVMNLVSSPIFYQRSAVLP